MTAGGRAASTLALVLLSGCALVTTLEGHRLFEGHWKIPEEVPDEERHLVATWAVPDKVKLNRRLMQVSGRVTAPDGEPLPAEVIVRVEISELVSGNVRKRFRMIVDRTAEDGFRNAKKFPKSVPRDSLVTLTVEPVGASLPAGSSVSVCLDLVKKRNELETFASCAAGQAATTLSGIQVSVFSGQCATSGCHDSITAEQGLVLETGQSFANLVDVGVTQAPGETRVRPGEPERSWLVRKLRGTQSIGGRMPLGGPFLSDEEVAGIVEWIENGARDN